MGWIVLHLPMLMATLMTPFNASQKPVQLSTLFFVFAISFFVFS